MKEALKPCPHCGQNATIMFENGRVFVECQRCGARSGWYAPILDKPEKAFESIINTGKWAAECWNARA